MEKSNSNILKTYTFAITTNEILRGSYLQRISTNGPGISMEQPINSIGRLMDLELARITL